MAEIVNDNRVTVELFGNEYEVEGSLGACKIYADEFYGKLAEPYTGNLVSDLLELYKAAELSGDQMVLGDVALYRLAWAMGRAAGSIKVGYDKFAKSFEHAPFCVYEWSTAYNVIVHELGNGVFFRVPEGLADAGEPDQAEAE